MMMKQKLCFTLPPCTESQTHHTAAMPPKTASLNLRNSQNGDIFTVYFSLSLLFYFTADGGI